MDIKLNDELRASSVNEVMKESPNLAKENPIEFIKRVGKKFLEARLDAFPQLCEITRWQNKLKWDELNQHSIKGKYTDTYGWSEGRNFKFDFEIPDELYLFMVNMVYKRFWEEDNEKVWRKFMNKICKGEDPMQTLMWAKSIYGNNQQQGIVLN